MVSKYRYPLITLGLMLMIFATIIKNISTESDWLIVAYGQWGVRVVNWSPKRKLIATTIIPKDTPIWVPGGWGWYEAGNLEKVEKIEGGKRLVAQVMFYNLGLDPNVIVNDRSELGVEEMFKRWGRGRWWWWLWDKNSWLIREDPQVENGVDFLTNWDRLVITGYTPTDRQDVAWRVLNATGEQGLGSFIAQRLSWGGVWVNNVANSSDGLGEKCKIRYNKRRINLEASKKVDRINTFFNCIVENREDLDEVELVIGPGMADLIKYKSYVRAF